MVLHTHVLEYCRTCPLYRNTLRFVPPEGNVHASICIVGQSPGTNEFFEGRPFVGKSGEMIAKYLVRIFDIDPPHFHNFLATRGSFLYITNACVCEVLTPVPKVKKTFCYDRLHTELRQISPHLIVTFGGQALEYVTRGEITSVMSARGFLLRTDRGFVFPMIHPASIMRQQEQQWLFESDMEKLERIIKGTYAEPSPLIFQVNTLGALEDLTKHIESLPEDAVMSFDLETTDVNPFRASIICLSLSFEDWVGYTIPMDDPIVAPYIKRILGSKCRKVAQNCKFDLSFLKRNGFCVSNMYFDTMVAQHILNENLPADLNTLVTLYLDYPKYDLALEKFKREQRVKSYAEIPRDILFKYAAHDAIVTRMIALRQIEEIKVQGFERLYWGVEFPTQLAFVDVELTGVLVDKEKVDSLTKQVVSEIRDCERTLFKATGYEFNYRSSKQLSKALYTDLKFPIVKRTPTGSASSDEETLQKLKSKAGSDPVKIAAITSLLKLRSRQKLLSTYLAGGKGGIWRFVEADGRVHPDFRVTGTVTGRISATNPPIQTIPKSAVRSVFTVPAGYKFIEADLNSAELYALAWYARCRDMLDQLNSGKDFHIQTAERIFKKKVKKGDIERKLAKFAVYGISYGRGAASMTEQFKLPLEEAQNVIDSLFSAYPEIPAFLHSVVATARKERILQNVFGRTRIFPRDCEFLSVWERQALNFLPQCVEKGSLVLTENGYMPIERCDGVKVFNGKNFATAKLQGPLWKEKIEVITDQGLPLRASKDHRVCVLTRDSVCEKFVHELQLGELLITPLIRMTDKKKGKIIGSHPFVGESKFRFSKVTQVRPTGQKVEMYDLTVQGSYPYYVCQGYLVHNSTVADHTNQTLWMLQMAFKEKDLDARVIVQLHDAIMVEVHESILEEVVDLIRSLYTRPVANTDLAIPVDIEVGDSWKGGDHLFEE